MIKGPACVLQSRKVENYPAPRTDSFRPAPTLPLPSRPMTKGPQTVSTSRRFGAREDMRPVPSYPDPRIYSDDLAGRDGNISKVGAESVVLPRATVSQEPVVASR